MKTWLNLIAAAMVLGLIIILTATLGPIGFALAVPILFGSIIGLSLKRWRVIKIVLGLLAGVILILLFFCPQLDLETKNHIVIADLIVSALAYLICKNTTSSARDRLSIIPLFLGQSSAAPLLWGIYTKDFLMLSVVVLLMIAVVFSFILLRKYDNALVELHNRKKQEEENREKEAEGSETPC